LPCRAQFSPNLPDGHATFLCDPVRRLVVHGVQAEDAPLAHRQESEHLVEQTLTVRVRLLFPEPIDCLLSRQEIQEG
jgi:hypothetical protein